MERVSLSTAGAEFVLCAAQGVATANAARAGSRDTRSLQVQWAVSDGAGLQQGRRWWARQLLLVLVLELDWLGQLTTDASKRPRRCAVHG